MRGVTPSPKSTGGPQPRGGAKQQKVERGDQEDPTHPCQRHMDACQQLCIPELPKLTPARAPRSPCASWPWQCTAGHSRVYRCVHRRPPALAPYPWSCWAGLRCSLSCSRAPDLAASKQGCLQGPSHTASVSVPCCQAGRKLGCMTRQGSMPGLHMSGRLSLAPC